MSVIMFGPDTFLPRIVRQQRFCNYGHEEIRGGSLLLKTYLSIIVFYTIFLNQNLKLDALKDVWKNLNVSFKMVPYNLQ